METEFRVYQEKNSKLKSQLPSGKNLAMLQGVSRREKDAQQIFTEKCAEFCDQMDDISDLQPDMLIKQNSDMLKACVLFEVGGNYSNEEVEWYRGQMEEIDSLF